MINGKTTIVQHDGVMVHDVDRPYGQPAIFATQEQADRFAEKAGAWPDRVIRPVVAGDVIPLHHHRGAYFGIVLPPRVRS